ncbi:energy-coupling factor transporter ATPase [Lactobacillus psittaci]|uniref:Energy-coupling factor transporter ATP-binding protein EcfA2 n=1 Tax=Lactobacillus psittaci DSM 15354 TaxID=1122152 RepID=A0A0R1S3N8_9LACO|nr:energy-coupling factor transporter ATPase [Lactobacillus psittaci]KRL63150.1 ABC transporter, ATP-binding protein [Lactobacillus psittaci DSM 15354]
MPITFEKVSYVYEPGTPFAKKGLDNVSFTLKDNKFIALIGHTGSGKSTLMQHFNALLKPANGEIRVDDFVVNNQTKNRDLKRLRKNVSLVFQFPEAQLFESTVIKDIEFGPKNFGFDEAAAESLSYKWLEKVGLDKKIASKSPFDLSGGQMRRVAIAGVMAYEPKVLCLDEPAAGLDPQGRKEMMQLFKEYQLSGHTVILVTHNMDDVANYADDVLVMEHGQLIKHDVPEIIFQDSAWLKQHHLDEPSTSLFAQNLVKHGFTFSKNPLTMEELIAGIKKNLVI